MEGKGNKKTKIVIAILVLLVLVLGGYIVYEKVLDNKVDEPVKTEKKKVKIEKKEEKTQNIKLDKNKEYIYDANYLLNSEYKMPYININSSDAIQVNGYLEGRYNSYMEHYKICSKENIPCHIALDYKQYLNNNIISVVIRYNESYTSVPDSQFLIYNFDLSTGKLMTYSDVLNKLKITKESATNKFKEKIRKYDVINDGSVYTNDGRVPGVEAYSDEYKTQENIEKGISFFEQTSDDKLYFFVNKNNLNIITRIYSLVDRGEFWETIAY